MCRLLPTLLFILLCSTVASAQDAAVLYVTESQFQESYDPDVPVSGGAIVGIQLGRTEGNIDVKNVRLPAFKNDTVCVRIVTQDGRFSANNTYRKTETSTENTPVKLSRVSVRYEEILSSYKMSAFALSAFFQNNGSYASKDIIYLPQILPDADKTKVLTVLVNSGGRFANMDMADSDFNFQCENVREGARIAYDTICKGDISTYAPGVKSISVTLDDGFGEEQVDFSLLLP